MHVSRAKPHVETQFDQSGKILLNRLIRHGNELSVEELSTGVYMVIARGKDGVQSLKIFVN